LHRRANAPRAKEQSFHILERPECNRASPKGAWPFPAI
jgi:hypothetical protein